MKSAKMCLLYIFMITLFCSKENSTVSRPVTPEDLLVKDGEISGWQRTGDSWTAGSSSELSTYINGEEPLYTRHGFVEAAMQQYNGTVLNNSVTISIRIFDQGNSSNARSLFDEIILLLVNPIDWSPGAGNEAKIERLPLTQRILFYKSDYLVSLTITSYLDEALEVLKTFANNLDSKID